jgi:serine/threonine protein kinase
MDGSLPDSTEIIVVEDTELLYEKGDQKRNNSASEGIASPAPMAPVGLRERFEFCAKIGQGGMAEVYRARDRSLQRDVTVKILRADRLDHVAGMLERFKQEAEILAKLEGYPNVVPVYDYGHAADGRPYIVKRHIDGCSLADLLLHGSLSVKEALRIGKRTAEILGQLHSRRIVHCDVKPGNILIDKAGQVFLTDLGIARVVGETPPAGRTTGYTARYASPEQVEGKPLDHRTDIYSLGLVLYEMIAGLSPPQKGLLPDLANAYQQAQGHAIPQALEATIHTFKALGSFVMHYERTESRSTPEMRISLPLCGKDALGKK